MVACVLTAMFILAFLYALNTMNPYPAILTFLLVLAMWFFTGFAKRIG